IADARGKIIADVSRHDSSVAPVPRNTDFVDHFAFDKKWLKAFGDERVDLDGTPRAAHNHTVAILDSFTVCMRGADFDECARHETDEPRHVAAHGAGLPVLGNPVGCRDHRERISFAIAIEFRRLPDLRAGIRLCLGEWVLYRALHRFVVLRKWP